MLAEDSRGVAERAATQAIHRRRAARRVLPSAAVVALALLAAAPGAAQAAWPGSSGKVAWAHDGVLQVDDPFDDAPPITVSSVPKAENPLNPQAPTSAPAWSPDGTKIAFAKAIPDGRFPDHTAIFVADLSGPVPSISQVSQPYPGRVASCDTCDDGEATHDFAPVWTPQGDVAYVRFVGAGEDAPHVGEVGSSVRVAAVAGQQEGLVAHWNPKTQGVIQSIIWPQGANEPVAIAATPTGFALERTASHATLATELGIDDIDASPDGSRIVYRALTLAGPRIKVIRASTGELLYAFAPALSDAGVRYSPDGSRLILAGCSAQDGQQHCGFKLHTIPDPDGDIRPDDPEEQPYLDGNPSWVVGPNTAAGGRSTFDVQAQDMPVIFIPGFLGSEITCGGEHVWMPSAPPIHLERVALGADGRSEAACTGIAGPTGKEVDSFLGADVYGHATDWLRALKQPRKGAENDWYVLGWDWRKAPQESLQRLDEQIDRLLANPRPKAQGVRRVAIATHSYGSLLLRRYLADAPHAKKVARAVTVGAPWWGAPKPMFPIAFGIETPGFSALDLFIKNDNLRTFMINSAGAYSLMPSDHYGQWLTYDGQPQDQAGVAGFLGSTGGNTALFGQARALHQQIDGFTNAGGTIDMRNVTGLGLATVTKVNVAPTGDGEASVGLVFGQGDGTVPVRSSAQGDEGTQNGLGDRIHQQYRCGIPHMRQTADEFTQRAYGDFLLDGAVPRKLPVTHCALDGLAVKVYRHLELGQPSPRAARAARAASAPRTLADAEFDGDVDVLQLPDGTTTVVTSDPQRPVAFPAEGDVIEVAPITDAGAGAARRYGPLTGQVTLGGTAEAPQVLLDGQAVSPQDAAPAPTPAATPGPGAAVPTANTAPAGSAGQPTADLLRVRLTVARRLQPDRRGRLTLRVRAAAAATGTVELRDAKGRLLARRARITLRHAGTVRVRVTLTAAARRAIRQRPQRMTITARLTPVAGGPTSVAARRITVRR